MYYVITKNNTVIGITTYNAYEMGIEGVSVHEMDGEIPDLNQYEWNFETDSFVLIGDILTRLEFIKRFTLEERMNIYSSEDLIVKDIIKMLELATYINVSDPSTIAGVNYFVASNLVTSERALDILR